jgi:hypothetical protein
MKNIYHCEHVEDIVFSSESANTGLYDIPDKYDLIKTAESFNYFKFTTFNK